MKYLIFLLLMVNNVCLAGPYKENNQQEIYKFGGLYLTDLKNDPGCCLVVDIDKGKGNGFLKGDKIVSVNKVLVADISQMSEVIRKKSNNGGILFRVKRGDSSYFIVFKSKDKIRSFAQERNVAPANKKTPVKDNKIYPVSGGTGFALSNDGFIASNYHVIEGCSEVKIHSNQAVFPASVLSYDIKNDLAIIKGDFSPSNFFSLGNRKVNLLEDIYVAGYPFGESISTSLKVTKGIISSTKGIGNDSSRFQIDAALQPGNSGGPIVNEKGNLVGIAVAKADYKYFLDKFGVLPENINFGIKSSTLQHMLDDVEVVLPKPNKYTLNKIELGKLLNKATYRLSCWMTSDQVELMKEKKVLHRNLKF